MDVPTVAQGQGHRDGGKLILATYADEVRLDHSLRMSKLRSTKRVDASVPRFENSTPHPSGARGLDSIHPSLSMG